MQLCFYFAFCSFLTVLSVPHCALCLTVLSVLCLTVCRGQALGGLTSIVRFCSAAAGNAERSVDVVADQMLQQVEGLQVARAASTIRQSKSRTELLQSFPWSVSSYLTVSLLHLSV